MTVFGHVYDDRLFPAEKKITCGSTNYNGKAQPNVVGHEDQHQHIADHKLNHVESGLESVDAT